MCLVLHEFNIFAEGVYIKQCLSNHIKQIHRITVFRCRKGHKPRSPREHQIQYIITRICLSNSLTLIWERRAWYCKLLVNWTGGKIHERKKNEVGDVASGVLSDMDNGCGLGVCLNLHSAGLVSQPWDSGGKSEHQVQRETTGTSLPKPATTINQQQQVSFIVCTDPGVRDQARTLPGRKGILSQVIIQI